MTWLHSDGVTPVTVETPARLGETGTAQMTGMGPVDESGSTTVGFQWSLVESYPSVRGGRKYVKIPNPVSRSRATEEGAVYLVTVTLPGALSNRWIKVIW